MKKVGGAFKLSALIQKRLRELNRGDKPLVSGKFSAPIEIVFAEIAEGKISLEVPEKEVMAIEAALGEESESEGESQAEE